MGLAELKLEINNLSLSEKADLLDELWHSLNQKISLIDEQKEILDARYAEFKAGKIKTYSAEEVHQELRSAYL